MEYSDIILQYVNLWTPAIAAVLGIVATVILTIAKLSIAIKSMKDENFMTDIRESYQKSVESNEELKNYMQAICTTNEQLRKENERLLEELTKIKRGTDNGPQ